MLFILNLKVGEYKWIENFDFIYDQWENWTPDQSVGYVIECSLSIPDHLHQKMDQFPLAPTSRLIKYDDLSPYCKKHVKNSYQSVKLVGDLEPKEKYVCSYQTLQFYLRQGLKLTKVHRCISFKQAPIGNVLIFFLLMMYHFYL